MTSKWATRWGLSTNHFQLRTVSFRKGILTRIDGDRHSGWRSPSILSRWCTRIYLYFLRSPPLRTKARCELHVCICLYTHTIHVWYIYLYLVHFYYGKCRYICHTWMVWDSYISGCFYQHRKGSPWQPTLENQGEIGWRPWDDLGPNAVYVFFKRKIMEAEEAIANLMMKNHYCFGNR